MARLPRALVISNQNSKLLQRHLLKPPERQQKSVVIYRNQRVAADPFLHAPGDDTREGIICAAANQRMEKIMRVIGSAIKLDEHFRINWNFRDADLCSELLDDRLCVRD